MALGCSDLSWNHDARVMRSINRLSQSVTISTADGFLKSSHDDLIPHGPTRAYVSMFFATLNFFFKKS